MSSGLVFACGETSGVQRVSGLENTTATYHNTTRSRCALICTGSTGEHKAILNSALASAAIRLTWYQISSDTDSPGFWWTLKTAAGVGILRIFGTSSGAVCNVQYWNGSSWTSLGSSWAASTYSGLKVAVDISITTGASGTATVSFNGVLIASGAIGTATGSIGEINMRHADDANSSLYSEIMVGDGTRGLTGCVLETEAPTADGTDTAGTGTFADVDEAVNDNAATSLLLAANGDQHSFTSPARTDTHAPGTILGVSVAAEMMRDVSGVSQARFYLKIGGTRYYSSTFALTTTLAAYQYTWAQNPATAADWTQADATAAGLEWGIEALT